MNESASDETVPLIFRFDDGRLKNQVINGLVVRESRERNNRRQYDNGKRRIDHGTKLGLNVVVFLITIDGASAIDLFGYNQSNEHVRKYQFGQAPGKLCSLLYAGVNTKSPTNEEY